MRSKAALVFLCIAALPCVADAFDRAPMQRALPQPPCPPPVSTPWSFSPHTRNGHLTFVATISISCPSGVSYELSIQSANDCRLMGDGGAIPYRVYLDSAHISPLPLCGMSAGQPAFSGTGTQIITIYGDALFNDDALAVGRYTDSITFMLTYGATNAH